MSKTTVNMVVLAIFFISLGIGRASMAGVAGSVHDFSTGGTSGFRALNEDEVCIFCHTPHGGEYQDVSGNRVPLWNKDLTAQENATYTMYGQTTPESDTYNAKPLSAWAPITGKPLGISLLCLSCHDGVATSEIDVVINYSPDGPISMPANMDAIADLGAASPPHRNPNIGQDLSNDHPISILYNNAPPTLVSADTATRGNVAGLKDPSLIDVSLKLFNGRIECATCHDPHDDGALAGKAPFLRMSNAGSAMCTSCHIR